MGSQLVRTWFGPLSIRTGLNYEFAPFRLRSLSATATMYRSDRLQATLRVNEFFRDEFGNNSFSAEFTRLFDRFTMGLNLSYYEETGSSVGVTFGTFLARDVRSNSWASAHRHMANRAAASVRTFIDLNANRIYDGDDVPLKNVGFLNLVAWRKIRTSGDGIALLPGLQVHRAQTIELDLTTVDDPFLVPVSEGVNVLGHPGGIIDIELPFTYVGEIEGMVVDEEHPELAIRNVGLELVDGSGKRVHAVVVEFDGFYYFPDVFPGEYTLRAVAATINTRVYELPAEVTVNVPGRGGYIQGPDIVLKRKPKMRESEPMALHVVGGGTPPPSSVPGSASEKTIGAIASPVVIPLSSPDTAPGDRPSGTDEPFRPPLRLPRDGNCTGR